MTTYGPPYEMGDSDGTRIVNPPHASASRLREIASMLRRWNVTLPEVPDFLDVAADEIELLHSRLEDC